MRYIRHRACAHPVRSASAGVEWKVGAVTKGGAYAPSDGNRRRSGQTRPWPGGPLVFSVSATAPLRRVTSPARAARAAALCWPSLGRHTWSVPVSMMRRQPSTSWKRSAADGDVPAAQCAWSPAFPRLLHPEALHNGRYGMGKGRSWPSFLRADLRSGCPRLLPS